MISSDLLKGSLKTIILKTLQENGAMYGYQLTRKVEEQTKGKIVLTFGALYPILHKLEKEKVLGINRELKNNRVRVYYSLTPKGHSMAADKIRELNEFIDSLQLILKPNPRLSHA